MPRSASARSEPVGVRSARRGWRTHGNLRPRTSRGRYRRRPSTRLRGGDRLKPLIAAFAENPEKRRSRGPSPPSSSGSVVRGRSCAHDSSSRSWHCFFGWIHFSPRVAAEEAPSRRPVQGMNRRPDNAGLGPQTLPPRCWLRSPRRPRSPRAGRWLGVEEMLGHRLHTSGIASWRFLSAASDKVGPENKRGSKSATGSSCRPRSRGTALTL